MLEIEQISINKQKTIRGMSKCRVEKQLVQQILRVI